MIGPAVSLLAILASAVLDAGAGWFLSARDRQLDTLVAADRVRQASYRRAAVFGPPLEQNAALWYDRAFSHMPERSASEVQALGQLATATHQLSVYEAHQFDGLCREAAGPRVRDALRCMHCDWQLDPSSVSSWMFDATTKAVTLGYCLVLNGSREATAQRAAAAARFYLQALSFGCDLGSGNLIMNIVGIGVTQNAVRSLGRLVASTTLDQVVLTEIADRLEALTPSMPDLRNGMQLDQLVLTAGLTEEARASASYRKQGLGRLVPWYTLAAIRLSRDLALVRSTSDVEAIDDVRGRTEFVENLRRRSRISSSPLMQSLDYQWLGAIATAHGVRRDTHAVVAAVQAEQWYVLHRKYPTSLVELGMSPDGLGFRYEPTSQGRGYRLVASAPADRSEVLFERVGH